MKVLVQKLKILAFKTNYRTLHPAVELAVAGLVPVMAGQRSRLTASGPLDCVPPPGSDSSSGECSCDRSDSDAFLHRRAEYEQASAGWRSLSYTGRRSCLSEMFPNVPESQQIKIMNAKFVVILHL